MMTAAEVIRVMDALRNARIPGWLDGGWGIDALLGEQTREHDDLDLVVGLNTVDAALEALRPYGYSMGLDERPTRLVLQASIHRRIDLHTVIFDSEGGGVHSICRTEEAIATRLRASRPSDKLPVGACLA
jgi:lincosamide nucleotidyltransferase A/C/D/E